MRYQLVLHFLGDSVADLEVLVSLEERIGQALGHSAEVDGHDIGSGESNVFVLTDDPWGSVGRIRSILDKFAEANSVRVAFREVAGGDYTVLWPRGFKGHFSVA